MPAAAIRRRLVDLARLAARDQVARGLGWLGAGELVARASRIVTTIVVARLLGPVELGIAAMAITAFEIVRAFAASGLGQLVARAPADRLAATLAAATRAGRNVCVALAVVQVAVGAALALTTGRLELLGLVGCLAGVFLMMPFGLGHCWLVMRDSRMGTVAGVSTAQVVAENALVAALAFAGLGAWAVVLPKLVTVPIWVLGMRRAAVLPPPAAAAPVGAREVWTFTAPILASDLVAAARQNFDRLIVGALLGVEALGIHWFAVNAGLGLGLSLSLALAASAYPVLAAVAHDRAEMLRRFDGAILAGALPVAVVVLLQAATAPFYVPMLFGAKWAAAVPLVVLLCLAGLTRPFADAAAQLLRAAGMPGRELAGQLAATALQLGAFAAAIGLLGRGLAGAAATLAVVAAATNLAFLVWARRSVSRPADAAGVGSADIEPSAALLPASRPLLEAR